MPNPRYDGKPLLRLLELYVLWAIGELSISEARTLEAMTPKLQKTFGASGNWHDVVASAVQIPDDMQATIRRLWAENTQLAHKNRLELTPQRFAEMFVDENLARR
jgi:hypothetical protein